MKNSKALVSLSNEARSQIITMLEAKDQEETAGWLLDEVTRIFNNHVQPWEFPNSKEIATLKIKQIGKLEALEYILTINNELFADDITSNEMLQMLKNDTYILSELFAAIGTRLYYDEISKREDYKIKDLIILLQPKEEK